MQAEEHEHTQAVPKLQPAVWQHVSDNIYRHRDRRKQHEDDIMICNCPTPRPGHLGCGPNCLNRLLNLECVPVRQLATQLCMVDTVVYTAVAGSTFCLSNLTSTEAC